MYSGDSPEIFQGIPGKGPGNSRRFIDKGNPDPFRRRPPRIGQASPKNFAVIPRGTSTNLPSVGVVFPRSLHDFRGNPREMFGYRPRTSRGFSGEFPANPW